MNEKTNKPEQRENTEVELSMSEETGIRYLTRKAVSLSCSIVTLKNELICGQYI